MLLRKVYQEVDFVRPTTKEYREMRYYVANAQN